MVQRVAQRTGKDATDVETVVDAALKQGKSVSLRNFGTFYILRRTGTVFKFNPSQRLKALSGWSSTYKGEL